MDLEGQAERLGTTASLSYQVVAHLEVALKSFTVISSRRENLPVTLPNPPLDCFISSRYPPASLPSSFTRPSLKMQVPLLRLQCGVNSYDWGKKGDSSAAARFAAATPASDFGIQQDRPYAEV